MIEVFKNNTRYMYGPDVSLKLAHHSGSITRGNKYELTNHRFHYDLRKHYFSARTVNIWNSLHVFDVTNVNLFKARLDRFWMDQDVKYNFTAGRTGTGDRSEDKKYMKHSFYIVQLSLSCIGCYMGLNFCGALAYADDIVLIAPTASAMRKMLSVCESFAARFDIQFNAQKSKCMIVSVRKWRSLRSIKGDMQRYITKFMKSGF